MERIELHDNGTGIYLGAALNADPSLTWTFQDNEVVAVFNNPEGFFSYPTIDGYGQIPELNVRTQMRLTRLVDGGGRDAMLAALQVGRITKRGDMLFGYVFA